MQDWIAYWKQVYADLCWYIIDQKLKEIWSYCSRYATVNYFHSLLTSPNDFSAANSWDTCCNTWSSAEFLIAYTLVLIKSVHQSEISMWKQRYTIKSLRLCKTLLLQQCRYVLQYCQYSVFLLSWTTGSIKCYCKPLCSFSCLFLNISKYTNTVILLNVARKICIEPIFYMNQVHIWHLNMLTSTCSLS